jgi:ankyrin repeat protein
VRSLVIFLCNLGILFEAQVAKKERIVNNSDRLSELFTAIGRSNVEQVKELLTSEIFLEQKNSDGQTPLTLASSIGNSEIIHLLIAAGSKVNTDKEPLVFNPQISSSRLPGGNNLGEFIAQVTEDAPEEAKNFYSGLVSVVDAFSNTKPEEVVLDEDEDEEEDEDYEEDSASTPLGAAVLAGDIDTVKALLQAGASPNPSVWHETPVMVMAARKGNVEIVSELIAAGANVNRGFDELPLHTAAEKGHLEVVHLLLDAGADVEAYEEDQWTALMAASSAGHLPVVKLLVEKGANASAWGQGETPVICAAKGVHPEVYEFLHPLVDDETRAIGDRDGEQEMANSIRKRTREQNKPVEKLVEAAMFGKLEQVQEIIASGVDVNSISACGRTALSLAIQGGYIPVIKALLDAGADPNLPDETNDGLPNTSPLMEATSTFFAPNRFTMVRLLMQRGADVNQQDAKGKTALMYAVGRSDADIMRSLIQGGANLDIGDFESNTALMRAKNEDLAQAVNILKQAGASEQGLKEVELLKAVDDGNLEKVKSLLQGNINVNMRVEERTALCQSANHGHLEIVKLLIAAGADVELRGMEGHLNPLLYAAYAGNLEVVRVLLEAGADVHVRVQDYLNPLEYAELAKHDGHRHNANKPFDEVIALLKQYGATSSII